MINAYERGRSDASDGAHVRSNDEDYLRGYAEGIAGIPGAQSMDVHIARSDAWAARPPSRTDAAYLAAYEREIRDCLARMSGQGTNGWWHRAGMRDAVQRIPPKSTHVPEYLHGYAEAAAVLLGAPAKVPTPAPDPAQAVQRAQADAADGHSHQEETREYLAAYVEAVRARADAPLSAAASRMRQYAAAASSLLGQPPVPPPQQPRPDPVVLPKAAPTRLTPKTTVAPTPAKTEPSPPKGPTVGPRETLLEVD